MDTALQIAGIVLALLILFLFFFEYRLRRPDFLVLHESNGRILLRKGLLYPRHFSLLIKRASIPVQLSLEAATAGNLSMRVRLVGSTAASLEHLQALIRVGGWDEEAVPHATEEVKTRLQELVKEYTESRPINSLTSAELLDHLVKKIPSLDEKYGVELITLAVQSLEPVDPAIGEALRQQEQARLLEQTERSNQQARISAARLRSEADEEIARIEHSLELKKAELKQALQEKESALLQQNLTDELARDRMRLAFEKEELEALKKNPELLMLTPQAARLAEASQSMKNARTVVSLTPQDSNGGSDLLRLFQEFLERTLQARSSEKQE